MNNKPRYPIYIPSKDRAESALTMKCFLKWNVDFKIVVEPSQEKKYKKHFNESLILVLPEDGLKLLGARLWIRNHSKTNGFKRHWQFDDNIRSFRMLNKGIRIRCNPNKAIRVLEDFTDRYVNVGISGFDYQMFVLDSEKKPFIKNVHIYSASLINNEMPYKWRLFYNDDTDLCLQVLTNGLCTIQFKMFMVEKSATMIVKGGNTKDLYQKDGRLIMARTLEEMWPDIVKTKWKYGRPQHVVRNNWKEFKQPLIKREDINWGELAKQKYDFKLKQIKDTDCTWIKRFIKENGSKTVQNG